MLHTYLAKFHSKNMSHYAHTSHLWKKHTFKLKFSVCFTFNIHCDIRAFNTYGIRWICSWGIIGIAAVYWKTVRRFSRWIPEEPSFSLSSGTDTSLLLTGGLIDRNWTWLSKVMFRRNSFILKYRIISIFFIYGFMNRMDMG